MSLYSVMTQTYGQKFLLAIQLTLLLAFSSWVIAMVLGTILAALRDLNEAWCGRFVTLYVAYHRNVPMLVHVLLWYFGISNLLPMGWQIWAIDNGGEIIFATIAIALCSSAYFAEDIRSGIRAVPVGQWEAARSLGFGPILTLRYVVLPQAFRAGLPSMINNTVVLFKNTSMAMAIGVAEVTYISKEIVNASFLTFPIYAAATVFYVLGSMCIMLLGEHIGRSLQRQGS